MNQILTLGLFTGLFAIFTADQVKSEPLHPDVVAAMNWQPADHECKPPHQRSFSFSIDIDKYNDERQTWLDCVQNYGQALVSEIDMLKSSAQHGLTQPQGTRILGNMALAQSTLDAFAAEVKKVMRSFPSWRHGELENFFRNGG
jgi:hypothetical protein